MYDDLHCLGEKVHQSLCTVESYDFQWFSNFFNRGEREGIVGNFVRLSREHVL